MNQEPPAGKTLRLGGHVHLVGNGRKGDGCLQFTDLGPAFPDITLPVFLFIQRIYRIEKQTRKTAAPPACRELI